MTRQNLICALSVAFGLGALAASVGQTISQSFAQSPAGRVVTSELNLVDSRGRVRAKLSVQGTDEEETALVLYDAATSGPGVTISTRRALNQIVVSRPITESAIVLVSSDAGGGGVQVIPTRGEPLRMRFGSKGEVQKP
jgi:hypothetical protein